MFFNCLYLYLCFLIYIYFQSWEATIFYIKKIVLIYVGLGRILRACLGVKIIITHHSSLKYHHLSLIILYLIFITQTSPNISKAYLAPKLGSVFNSKNSKNWDPHLTYTTNAPKALPTILYPTYSKTKPKFFPTTFSGNGHERIERIA